MENKSNGTSINPEKLTRFMAGLTTVFVGLGEMFSSITEQMDLATDAAFLLRNTVDETEKGNPIANENVLANAEAKLRNYTAPTRKSRTIRKRPAAKKAVIESVITAEPISEAEVVSEVEATTENSTASENATVSETESASENDLPEKPYVDYLPFDTEQEDKPPDSSGMDDSQSPTDIQAPTGDQPPTITKDLLTKTVVAKIKQKRSNSEAIGKLVKSYGVAQLSDLTEDKYEDFLNDLSQL